MLSKEEINSLWPFYFYSFMRGVLFLTTITLFIFFTDKGLSYTQGAILVAFTSLIQVMFELITGSIADTFGRKRSVLISLFLDSIIIFLIAITNSFWSLFALFGLWGVSTTLASGSDKAWAIDSLIQTSKEKLLDQYYSKSRMFYNAGMIIASITSSAVLIYSDNQMLWFIRASFTLILAVILFMFAKEKFIKPSQVSTIKATLSTFNNAISIFRNNSFIRILSIASFFTFFAAYLAESVAIQDIKVQAGIPLEWWGILFLIATVLGLYTPRLGMNISKKFKNSKDYLVICYSLLAVLYGIAVASLNIVFIAILVILYIIINDFYEPVEEKLYNEHTPSAQRATVNSIKAMIENAGLLVGMLLSGLLVDNLGGALTISIAAIFVIPGVILIYRLPRKQDLPIIH
ncbi:MAG: MFS transporter [Candidatus Woesearchaeota archaeon]